MISILFDASAARGAQWTITTACGQRFERQSQHVVEAALQNAGLSIREAARRIATARLQIQIAQPITC